MSNRIDRAARCPRDLAGRSVPRHRALFATLNRNRKTNYSADGFENITQAWLRAEELGHGCLTTIKPPDSSTP